MEQNKSCNDSMGIISIVVYLSTAEFRQLYIIYLDRQIHKLLSKRAKWGPSIRL